MSKTFHRILFFEESSQHGNQKYWIEMAIIRYKIYQEYHDSCLERFKFKLRQKVCQNEKIGVARSGS